MVDGERHVEHDRPHDRPDDLLPAHHRERDQHDAAVKRHLHVAGAPAQALLQVEQRLNSLIN